MRCRRWRRCCYWQRCDNNSECAAPKPTKRRERESSKMIDTLQAHLKHFYSGKKWIKRTAIRNTVFASFRAHFDGAALYRCNDFFFVWIEPSNMLIDWQASYYHMCNSTIQCKVRQTVKAVKRHGSDAYKRKRRSEQGDVRLMGVHHNSGDAVFDWLMKLISRVHAHEWHINASRRKRKTIRQKRAIC